MHVIANKVLNTFSISDEMKEPDSDMEFYREQNNHKMPNVREVSSAIHATDNEKPDNRQFSLLVMQLGQFLDHDLTLTPQTPSCNNDCGGGEGGEDNICCAQFLEYQENKSIFPNYTRRSECWPIPVKKEDPYFGDEGPQCLEFKRSQKTQCDRLLRTGEDVDLTQFNEITHFVDLSSIYGSLVGKSSELRVIKNGLLKFNQFKDDVLPFELNTCINASGSGNLGISHPLRHPKLFTAGDVRVNENPGLQSLHTLWVKEHNRLAKEIYSEYPDKDDEAIFQEARKFAIAEWQHIVYSEWLHMVLGEKYMLDYGLFNTENSHYDEKEKPMIVQEFSTAAFRFGHGLIRSIVDLYYVPDNSSQVFQNVAAPIKVETLELADHFFKTDVIQERKMHQVLMGMTHQGAKEFGPQLADVVRQKLFKSKGNVFGNDLGKYYKEIQELLHLIIHPKFKTVAI